MATQIKFKRGTRAKLDSLATAGYLITGEPIYITDEDRIAICTSNSTYETFAKESEVIASATSEFSGTIDETNDKFTIWDNSLLKWIRFSFTSMKTWLSTLYLKLDQTTPQTINGTVKEQLFCKTVHRLQVLTM